MVGVLRNNDFRLGFDDGNGQPLPVDDGVVYHTYSRTAPDRFLLAPFYYQLLDQVPDGREADFPLRCHDEYGS